jgi:hypothetical protein
VGGDWVDWREDRRAGLKVWPVCCGRARVDVGGLWVHCGGLMVQEMAN